MSEQTTNQEIDLKRRRFLTAATSVVGAVGVGFVAVPFLSSWMPSEKAKAAGAPVDVDISKLEEGQLLRYLWRKKAIFVYKRNADELARLTEVEAKLTDPTSASSVQPTYASNQYRSINPEIGVYMGICTHLGCSPTYRPEVGAADLGGSSWLGGFYCPCHGSKFDLAGRVFAGTPAPRNLEVPPYHYVNDQLIRIGVDPSA